MASVLRHRLVPRVGCCRTQVMTGSTVEEKTESSAKMIYIKALHTHRSAHGSRSVVEDGSDWHVQ